MKYRYRESHEMKDSGVEWLGMIPKDWEVKKIKYLCNIGTGGKDTQDKNPEGKYNFFVRSPIIEKIDSYSFDGEAILMAGDGVGAGKVFHYYIGKFDFHQRVYKFSNFRTVNGKVLYYYLKENFCKEIEKGSAKTTVDSLRLPMISNFPIVYNRNIKEQKKLIYFLDKKCEEFDSVIAKKEMLINKLEEAKKSLISEVVTGKVKVIEKENGEYGIIKREAHEMKDSGVEWLGMIPKEWEDTRCQWILKEISIKGHGNKEVLSLYREYGVIPKNSRDDNHNVTSENTNSYKLVKKDNLVLNKMKVWQGSIGVSKFEGIVSPAYIICEIAKEKVYSKYIHHLLRNKLYIPEYRRLSYGIREGQWDMRFEDFRKIPIFIPNLKKQQKIAEFLDKKCEEFDSTIEKQKESIEKLKSAKQSLISEAVTGKIEVL